MTKSEQIIDEVLLKLRDSEGFEVWWGDLTDYARDSIEAELVSIINNKLAEVIEEIIGEEETFSTVANEEDLPFRRLAVARNELRREMRSKAEEMMKDGEV